MKMKMKNRQSPKSRRAPSAEFSIDIQSPSQYWQSISGTSI